MAVETRGKIWVPLVVLVDSLVFAKETGPRQLPVAESFPPLNRFFHQKWRTFPPPSWEINDEIVGDYASGLVDRDVRINAIK